MTGIGIEYGRFYGRALTADRAEVFSTLLAKTVSGKRHCTGT
jgi:hypothetical protein